MVGLIAAFWPVEQAFSASAASKSRTVHKKSVKKKVVKQRQLKKAKPRSRTLQAKAAYCVNLANHQTVLARNADKPMPVASLTKLVTALVTLDRMRLDEKIAVPDHIKTIPKSVVGLKAGDTLSVCDLLHGLLIGSGNDCAETLACAYPGGRKSFIGAMNRKVRDLGMTNTVFYTPSGLDRKICHADKDGAKTEDVDSNVSTAREMAKIAAVAFSNKTIRSISLKRYYVLAGAKEAAGYRVRNTNKLLKDNLPLMGGKTGFTARAGHCLATTFMPGRNIFLIVVLGSPDHFGDTRLLYRKALKESSATRHSDSAPTQKVIARQDG